MDTLVIAAPEPTHVAIGRHIRRLQDLLTTCYQRAHQRRQLAELDARQLDDIGISREQALQESAKPFWRG